MDELLFAFSIFDRNFGTVESGHFGGARPIVIGSENKVIAFNQVPVQLRDGRDVRYWEVISSLNGGHLYLLSFDTSKLKAHVDDALSQRRGVSSKMIAQDVVSTSRRYLELALSRNELPRYYLAISRRAQNGSNEGFEENKSSPEKSLKLPA